MTFKDLFKNKAIIIAIISFALGALIYNFSSVILQEGNPWPQIKGIAQLTFGKSDIVKLSGSDNKYLTKSRGGWDAIDGFLRNDGYEFSEQMGSGYFYKSSSSRVVMIRRQYSRFYVIWKITESNLIIEPGNQVIIDSSAINDVVDSKKISKELEECLPKSDMASHEKCNELLKQITDYKSCVAAGFSIMKSNPTQCATPDGRIFVED